MIPWLLPPAVAVFWLGVIVRVERGRADTRWRLTPASPRRESLPSIAVVIPARDEAAHITACVAAVNASDVPGLDVVVFDDASGDGTGDLAAAAGARVVRGDGGPLPEGWKGKPWAIQRAMDHVDAEWTLFLDADVRVRPEAVSRAVTHALDEGLDFVSLLGKLDMESFWEKVIQPSVGGLILAGNDLGRANDPEHPERAIANGQFILVRTETWRRLGGHALVRDNILDDIGLARAFGKGGAKVRCLFGRELFSCRMYTGFSELWYGWTKNLYAGMNHSVGTVVFLVVFLCFYFLFPYVAAVVWAGTGPGWAWLGVLALSHAVRFRMDRIFGQDPRYGLLQGLGAACLVGLLVDSARRSRAGSIRWKGRTYAARG